MTAPHRYASIDDAATYAAVSPDTIRRLVTAGKIGRYQIGRRVLVDLNELDAYAARYTSKVA